MLTIIAGCRPLDDLRGIEFAGDGMLRTFVDPTDLSDIREAHALQDSVAVAQQDAESVSGA